MSEFDTQLDFAIDMITRSSESLRKQKKPQWSTSSASSYQDLMEKLSTEQQNTDFLKLYAKDQSPDGSAPVAVQAALRAQIQFIAVMRRAFRMKMVVGSEMREYSSVDHDRYAYNDNGVTLAKLNRLKESPAINPDDSAISGATEDNSDG